MDSFLNLYKTTINNHLKLKFHFYLKFSMNCQYQYIPDYKNDLHQHKLNQMFVKEILSNSNNYNIENLEIGNSSNHYINELTDAIYSHEEINVA